MLKPQDILVLLKILELAPPLKPSTPPLQKQVAEELFISTAEISFSLRRCVACDLYDKSIGMVLVSNFLEFLIHGLRYVYPAKRLGVERGIPTAWAAKPLLSKISMSKASLSPVWPHGEGTVRGEGISPLYETAPQASLRSQKFYELLVLCDALRIGRARERKIAGDELKRRLGG